MQAFHTALAQNPVFSDAHRALARLHTKRFEQLQAAQHEQLAQAADQRIAAFKAGRPLPEDVDLELDVSLTESASLGDLGVATPPGPLAETIVIVSGLPRSGTSMLMQMLAAGGLPVLTDGQRAADDSNPRGYYEFEAAKKVGRDNAWLEQAKGKAVKIVAQLLPGLPPGPRYRVLFMERPLGEVVASQRAMLQRLGREGANLSERQLAATYRRQLDGVRQVLAAHPERVSVLAVNYHEALATPAMVATRVNAFLGGDLGEAAMAAAVAPELRHQRYA
jgi:hypothetical protein